MIPRPDVRPEADIAREVNELGLKPADIAYWLRSTSLSNIVEIRDLLLTKGIEFTCHPAPTYVMEQA